MMLRVVALLVVALVSPASAPHARAETCRFAGTTSHDGRLAIKADVTEAAGLITVDVTLTLAVSAYLSDVQYLTQETSTWRGGAIEALAANYRSIINGRIRRQQWDVWTRGPAGLQARRVQATSLDQMTREHPRFVRHWPPADFGQPWLADFDAAGPARRPDLDVPAAALTPSLRTPLALAFYWSRWLPPGGETAPVFLPGFKRDARTDIAFTPAVPGEGWRRWRAPLRHPALEGSSSFAAAWVSTTNYLLQLAAEVHASLGSGQALIRTEGCQGVQIAPTG